MVINHFCFGEVLRVASSQSVLWKADTAMSLFLKVQRCSASQCGFGQFQVSMVQCTPLVIHQTAVHYIPLVLVWWYTLGLWGVQATCRECSVGERPPWCSAVWGSVSLPQRDPWCRVGSQLFWNSCESFRASVNKIESSLHAVFV